MDSKPISAVIPDGQPDIESARLLMRKLRIDDATDMFEWAKDVNVTQFLSWEPHKTVDDSRRYIQKLIEGYARQEFAGWGVEYKPEKKLVGAFRAYNFVPQHQRAEISAAVNRRYQSRGVMTEVIDLFFNFAFQELPINRIEGIILTENTASQRMVAKLGMTYEGDLKQYYYIRGVYRDCKLFRMLREEYVPLYQRQKD